MPKRGRPGARTRPPGPPWLVMGLGAVALATGCEERDRLTFPNPGDGVGPVTLIDRPSESEITVSAGPLFFLSGRTIDPDGVDTVYFLVTGGSETFPPFRPSPPADTVSFGLPLTTLGHAGDTLVVRVYGVDIRGNQGDTASRRIAVE